MVEAQGPCGFCMSYRPGGGMTIRRDARAAEQSWVSVQLITTENLCAACFEWFGSLLRETAMGGALRPAGAPLAADSPAPKGDGCDVCHSHLLADSFAIELVPAHREMIRRDLFRFDSRLRQYRLCGGCLAWARSIEYDGGYLEAGQDVAAYAGDACTGFLLPADDISLEYYAQATGRSYRRAGRRSEIRTRQPGELYFVGSGIGRQAAEVIEGMTPDERARTFIVARYETLVDAHEALAKGAAELLASPLSPHQISGAYQRARERASGQRPPRSADGLPTLQPGPDRPGRPGQTLSLTAPRHATMETAWMLRRFLRGDDRIGFGQRDGLMAQVFCPDEHLGAVRARLAHLIGERTAVKELGRTAAAAPATLQKSA